MCWNVGDNSFNVVGSCLLLRTRSVFLLDQLQLLPLLNPINDLLLALQLSVLLSLKFICLAGCFVLFSLRVAGLFES